MSRSDLREEHNPIVEGVKTIVYALLIALVIRTFLFQPFNIPSSSMVNTLLIGDFLFVSKYSYGYSKHSLPFSPGLFSGRIFEAAPERGDVAVFKLPSDNSTDYIKRVIGLPGDRIQMIEGVLYINGEPVKLERIEDYVETNSQGEPIRSVPRYLETLPNGVTHQVLDEQVNGPYDNTGVYVVPDGHYFMMGDNRDNSTDSRVPGPRGVGFVPAENLVGRAEIIFFSTDGSARFWEVWKWPFAIRFSRIATTVD
ncbi:MAG: signal peptidase I [Alphaproteobacteria bacterium]|nr:signal peptidase I [Alphaproteobacteria bacterium]